MHQSGITTCGKPVCGGAFAFVGTLGTPLEIVLSFFKENGMVMDWPNYIEGALGDGHKPRTVKARIIAAVGDVYGTEYRKQVELRLEAYFDRKDKA